MAQPTGESLESLVERARTALAAAGEAGGDRAATVAEGADAGPAAAAEEFAGVAAEGRARAVVTADGHVRSLDLDPALLAGPLDEVAAAAAAAINAALAARPGTPDLSALVGVLTAAREQARREMAVVTTGFADVEAGVRAVRAAQGRPIGGGA